MPTLPWIAIFVMLGLAGVIVTVAAWRGLIPFADSERAKIVTIMAGVIATLASPFGSYVTAQINGVADQTSVVNETSKQLSQGLSGRVAALELARVNPTEKIALTGIEERLRKIEMELNGKTSPGANGAVSSAQ